MRHVLHVFKFVGFPGYAIYASENHSLEMEQQGFTSTFQYHLAMNMSHGNTKLTILSYVYLIIVLRNFTMVE